MNKHSQTVFFYRETQKTESSLLMKSSQMEGRPLHKARSLARWSQHSSAIAPPESPGGGGGSQSLS